MAYNNSGSDWYAPLAPKANEAEIPAKRKKKGMTPGRIAALVGIIVLLIIGSSMAFSRPQEPVPSVPVLPQENFSGDMPVNPKDFFDNYYESTESDVAQTNIPRVQLPIDFELELVPAEGEELELKELFNRCAPSIVAIIGYGKGDVAYSWGTGVILSADGLILTNTHVIDGCDSAEVTLYDERVFEAKLVGADVLSDIAVLKIEADGLPAASFGESGKLEVGDKVAAIGNPLGDSFKFTLTDGIISASARDIVYNGHTMNLLQTNAALNHGNSGGALFNMYGQVIGITNMKMASSYSSIEGIGFAIPSDSVGETVAALVRDGEVSGRTSIGITVGAVPAEAMAEYGMPQGLYVTDVSKNSDAERQGIKKGDVLVEVNGEAVISTDDVLAHKDGLKVGDSLHMKLWRNGSYYEVDVKLVDTNDIYG